MTKTNHLLLASLFFCFQSYATTLTVQQNGAMGTYNSISAAVTAAANGDTIAVVNRTDGMPWSEDITLNKSLTLVNALINEKFKVSGTYSVSRANNRSITIDNMENLSTSTNINTTGATATATNQTKLNIVNSILNGSLDLGDKSINLFFSSNSSDGNITFTLGSLIGNNILGFVECKNDFTSNDSILVVGNFIKYNGNNPSYYHNNNTQSLTFLNNYCYNLNDVAIEIKTLKAGQVGNKIINTSARSRDSHTLFIQSSVPANANLYITNCVLVNDYGSPYTILNLSTVNIGISYCVYRSVTNINILTGCIFDNYGSFTAEGRNSFTEGDNTGNPDKTFLDLDLTRNDIGCYGGSYSRENFSPINNGKSSNIHFVTTPRVIYQGETLRVDAIGSDR